MTARFWGLVALLLLLAGAVGLGLSQIEQPAGLVSETISEISQTASPIVSTPSPLRGQTDTPAQTLTTAGVFSETNKHRVQNNLPALTANAQLNQAAQAKLNDMLVKQYFEHVGPDGRGPSDWVEGAGYAYIAVGENLALGNFAGDQALVNAWMASPGHRANILSSNFAELGIAVGQGVFEGEQTWMAVQTFGTPVSACPAPAVTLETQFNQQKTLSSQLETELKSTETTLENLIAERDRLVREGNRKIEEGNKQAQQGNQEEAERLWAEGEALHEQARALEPQIEQRQAAYNDFVNRYNTLNDQLVGLANQLNQQINAYNACLTKFGS